MHACTHPHTRMHPRAHMQLFAHTESVGCFTLTLKLALEQVCKSFTGHIYFHVCIRHRAFQATLNPPGRKGAGRCKCILRRLIKAALCQSQCCLQMQREIGGAEAKKEGTDYHHYKQAGCLKCTEQWPGVFTGSWPGSPQQLGCPTRFLGNRWVASR